MSMTKNILTKTPLIFKVVSLYVVIAGQLWVANYFIDPIKPATVAQAMPRPVVRTEPATDIISGQPNRLRIDSVGIDLSIHEGSYDTATDQWTLSDDAAYFAEMTAVPNNKQGNTFIYGHNTAAVLEPVKDIAPGDLLTITTSNGHTFSYIYTHDSSVTPDQTDVLNPVAESPQVTLMTCQGVFSQTRRIMHFEFAGLA